MSNKENDLLNEQREENKTMNHTPTPWKFSINEETATAGLNEYVFQGGKLVCSESDKAYIKTACNAHEDLVLAVKRAFELEKANHGMTSHAFAYQEALAKAGVKA